VWIARTFDVQDKRGVGGSSFNRDIETSELEGQPLTFFTM
jgi:hypothetical protein